jgi:hypothetical protein
VKERREGRVGTVSGLALLAGGTALAAAFGGDHQSVSATILLGTLTVGLGHSLIEEMRRQARRASARWSRKDTANAVLLGVWAEAALLLSILGFDTAPTRGLGLALAVAYAACCGYFVTERRRTLSALTPTPAGPAPQTPAPQTPASSQTPADSEESEHLPTIAEGNAFSPPDEASASRDIDGTVVRRRHPGSAGHAPTAGHGPITRSHAAGHLSTMPAHSHPAAFRGPVGVRSEARR